MTDEKKLELKELVNAEITINNSAAELFESQRELSALISRHQKDIIKFWNENLIEEKQIVVNVNNIDYRISKPEFGVVKYNYSYPQMMQVAQITLIDTDVEPIEEPEL